MRYLFPFIFPTWLIAYPSYCYFLEAGRFVPDEEVRTFVYSSSGPWSHEFVGVIFVFSIPIAVIVHAILLVIMLFLRRWRDAALWLGGSLAGIATTWLTFYWFGNLMDI